ncbi:sugar-binding protein [Pseudomonas cichorii]|uniref:RHS repeat domain-containing protein n=1 Tax=Pseudomonas cichorii TaxID=36746 RepID=UPI001910503F|nr:RHS repeat protein [Pseudomonas cichorii]GFM84592.1 sugar-binding protein [Pseudomonas cichorii]
MNMALHTHTPRLLVIDPRGLALRSVEFCRNEQDQPVDERVTCQAYDTAGRLVSQRDPRLALPNLNTTYSLSNQALLTESVDAGWRLGLLGEAGQAVEGWDGRGTQRKVEYDAVLRPLAITEQGQVTERFGYGGPEDFEHNQCNQLIRHDDTAGTRHLVDYGVLGAALIEARHFLKSVETPDWPLDEAGRDALLQSDRLETYSAFNALGETLRQTDAMGHTQSFKQTVAGQLKAVDLTLSGATQAQTLVSDIHYNAFNQVEQETAGNGVISHSLYDPQDGRLMEIRAGSPALQHLIYAYDPTGNIQQIEDAAQPIRYFANQRVEAINHYRYDTLYQLIEATGREVNTGASHGPALPGLQPLPPDPNQISNYTQSYDYDSAGNLLQMRHVGAQNFTRIMRVAPDSNRSLPEGDVDVDFSEGFDPNGNLLQLVRGQTLEWDRRNQLQQITTITRATKANDHERYIYDGQAQRCRKINSTQTSSRTLNNEVRYLPGLEIRTNADGEILHVITAQAGRSSVQVLHWQAGLPSGIANNQVRYSLSDHLGSSTLELDQQGGLISQESYYPFGGTAWWAARSAVEAKYKTVRYSGKERDVSGLYYYGFRYYAPWLQRWINPDPTGDVNGLNLFCFVGNSPVCHKDMDGRIYIGVRDPVEEEILNAGNVIMFRGLDEFPDDLKENIKRALVSNQITYQHAGEMIRYYPNESADIMRSFFGYQYSDVVHDVTHSWESSYIRASEYLSDNGEGKFLGIRTPNEKLSAFIFPEDPLGRIAIDTRHAYTKKLPHTIGHELTHIDDVLESAVKGPSSTDNYYIFAEYISLLTGGGNTTQKPPYQAVSEIITSGGLNLNYFSYILPAANNFIERVKTFYPAPEFITDLNTAITQFNQNPGIAARVSANNADSLMHAAHHLHEYYMKNILTQTAPTTQRRGQP